MFLDQETPVFLHTPKKITKAENDGKITFRRHSLILPAANDSEYYKMPINELEYFHRIALTYLAYVPKLYFFELIWPTKKHPGRVIVVNHYEMYRFVVSCKNFDLAFWLIHLLFWMELNSK